MKYSSVVYNSIQLSNQSVVQFHNSSHSRQYSPNNFNNKL